jgi:2,4-dienoyl-CoA reductase-like NADH-dependent reductase (Old Yellow Enzyme family)
MPAIDQGPSPTPANILLRPYRLSPHLELANRVVMAPMTRSMAGEGLVPTSATAAYYARRADAGLLITEGAIVRADGQGYPKVPGIFTAAQVEGWREVTRRVHAEDGVIFLQLWHVGRVSHPSYMNGELPIAPSAIALEGRLPRSGGLEYGTPRAATSDEIEELVEAFAHAAANAVSAGFDGVEIHGANGYLVDQFLHRHSNRRDDAWGGSPAKMSRFALAVVDAVAARTGPERVGIRLSPGAYHHMEPHADDAAVFRHLLGELEMRRLAYVHVGIFDRAMVHENLGGTAEAFLRHHYAGTLIGSGGFTPASAAHAIKAGEVDLAAFGRPFIANPDLIARIRNGRALVPYDQSMLARLD